MGALRPGATYIYENDGQKIYAREVGSTQRQVIGETMDRVYQQRQQDHLWRLIREAADTNSMLRDVLDRAVMIYELTKK